MRGTVPTVRLGIVSTVRRMPDDEWFEHHRRVGVLRFYLNMPRSTAGARAAHAAAGDVSVMERAPDGGYAYISWHRQAEHVDAFLARAQGDGVTHLLHIDDDELLYLPRGYGPFARCLDSLTVHCAVVRNWEAVAPHPFVTSPVRECFLFRRDPAHFTAYANGKAIACMRHFPDVRADGAHRFAGDRHEVSPSTAVILHYESVRVADWSRKFEQYAAAPSAVEPPFRFYRESIAAFRDGGGDAIGVWRRHKMATAPGESVVHVHPSFTAPSILLVGNGPSLRGSRLGPSSTVSRRRALERLQAHRGRRRADDDMVPLRPLRGDAAAAPEAARVGDAVPHRPVAARAPAGGRGGGAPGPPQRGGRRRPAAALRRRVVVAVHRPPRAGAPPPAVPGLPRLRVRLRPLRGAGRRALLRRRVREQPRARGRARRLRAPGARERARVARLPTYRPASPPSTRGTRG